MNTASAGYPPFDTLKPVANDLWIVDSAPIKAIGLLIPIRMTVIRLRDGALLLHSPTRFESGLRKSLEELGPIKHLIAPNSAHWMFVREWQRQFPNAQTWAAPGLRQRGQVRRSGLRVDNDLGNEPPSAWAAEIEQITVPGLGGFAEIAFFHKPTRSLVLTDLVQNFEVEKLPVPMRPFARIAGVTAPKGRAPIYLRALVKLRADAARNAANHLIALRPERVIFAHGKWFDQNAAAELERSLGWMR